MREALFPSSSTACFAYCAVQYAITMAGEKPRNEPTIWSGTLSYMTHRCSNSCIHLHYVHGAVQPTSNHLCFTYVHVHTCRLSSNPMSWMGRCVMNVMVCSAMGNLLLFSVAVWHVFSTFVSTVGPPSTPFLADRTTAPCWKTSVLIVQGLTSCDAITVHSTCIQLPYQLTSIMGI